MVKSVLLALVVLTANLMVPESPVPRSACGSAGRR